MRADRCELALIALVCAAACAEDHDPMVDIDPVAEIMDEGVVRGASLASLINDELADASLDETIGVSATVLAAINDSRIQEAVFASNVVFGEETFELAEEITIDHQDANARLAQVVSAYGVPLLPSATVNVVSAQSSADLSTLRATAPNTVDFTYVQGQVVLHTETIVLLEQLALMVGPGAMASYISDTRIVMETNLATAIDLLYDFY